MRSHFRKFWDILRSKSKKKNRQGPRLWVEVLEDRCVPANLAPSGTSMTVDAIENTPLIIQTANFGFSDPNTPPQAFKAVEITTLPTAGTLTDNGTAVTPGQFVPVTDINAGKLVFTAAANATGSAYATFTFQVEDAGSTSGGGVTVDPTARTMTLDVQPASGNGNMSGTVSGRLFIDLNGTGTFASNDISVPGVTVTLTGTATDTSSQSVAITELSEATNTVTATTTTSESFKVGDKVTIANATVTGYDGTFTILTTPSATSFTFSDSTGGLGSDTSGTGTAAVAQNTSVDVTAVTDGNGDFSFENVLPGTYHLSGGDVPALVNGETPMFGNISASAGITVKGGQTLTKNAAGYQPGLNPGYISVADFLTDSGPADIPFGTAGSGRAMVEPRSNSAPTIKTQIANQTVAVGTTGSFDLAGAFTDPNMADDKVTFNLTVGGKQEKMNVTLDNTTAPQTVANFLDYVESGAYNNLFFTRETNVTSDGIGVLQAGGATIENGVGPQPVTALADVPGEVSADNTIGTIAMANSGSANSGNDEFFFNTADNTSLDSQAVYTVFGQVADSASQTVLTSLSSTPTYNLSSSSASISNATESGSTVTITTASSESFTAGETVVVSGVGTGYNGAFTIASVLSSTSFTYTDSSTGLSAATGGTANVGPSAAIASASESGGTVTITTKAPESFTAGQSLIIGGVGTGYDGTYTIASVLSPTSFTYTDSTTGLSAATGGAAIANPLFAQNNPGILVNEVPLTGQSGAPTNFPTSASNYVVINSVTIDSQPEVLSYSQPIVTVAGTSTPSNIVTATLVNERLNLTYNSPGTATVSVTATDKYGASVTMSFNVTVVGSVSDSQSTIAVTPGSVVSGGAGATVTLTAKDANGNQELSGGDTVVFGLGNGTAQGTFSSPVTDNGNGTYTATFTGTTAGTNTITATINGAGNAVTSTLPTITVTPGAVSAAESTVAVTPASVEENDASDTATVTLTAKDAHGNQETTGGAPVTFGLGNGAGQGTFSSPVTDNGNGTYTATFTGTTAGVNTITATVNSAPVTSALPNITVAGPASPSQSTVTAANNSVSVGGTTTVTLTERDANGVQLPVGGDTVVFSLVNNSGIGTFGPVTYADGVYTATFTGVLSGPDEITATINNGVPLTSTAFPITVT